MDNIMSCPDWQDNGYCFYDCKPLHCQDCSYGRQILKERKEARLVSAIFSHKYDDLTIGELKKKILEEE